MRTLGVLASVLLLTATVGCQTNEKRASDGADRASTPTRTVGWSKIRTGLDPVEVLTLLGEPHEVKVASLRTNWYYSADAGDGPEVVFDTRSMRVESWTAP